jgi:hypothetical protein
MADMVMNKNEKKTHSKSMELWDKNGSKIQIKDSFFGHFKWVF